MDRSSVYLIDTTLRDGEQSPGLHFSLKEKLEIAGRLDTTGIREVEAGTPAIGSEEQEAIREIAASGFSFITSCWCRAIKEDLATAAGLKTQSVNISLPVSEIQMKNLGMDRRKILARLKDILVYAGENFPAVSLGAQDASRADPSFLKHYIAVAEYYGVNRIRIADTVGIFDPQDTYRLMSDLVFTYPDLQFEFHGHNDLGMATANSVSAINAGTQCISATVNGIGERAGNAALEEIMAYLLLKKNCRSYNTRNIAGLCNYISSLSGSENRVFKAVSGKNAFIHESGIHTSAILNDPGTYQVADPSDFGFEPVSFVFGKHSGRASISHFFRSRSIPVNPKIAGDILNRLKTDLERGTKRSITESDLFDYYNRIRHSLHLN